MPLNIQLARGLQPRPTLRAKKVVYRLRKTAEGQYREYLLASDPVTFQESWTKNRNEAQVFSGNYQPPYGYQTEDAA